MHAQQLWAHVLVAGLLLFCTEVTQGMVLPGMPAPVAEREDFDYLLLTAPSQAQTPAAPWGGEPMTPPWRPENGRHGAYMTSTP